MERRGKEKEREREGNEGKVKDELLQAYLVVSGRGRHFTIISS